jgi:hypothetical protein
MHGIGIPGAGGNLGVVPDVEGGMLAHRFWLTRVAVAVVAVVVVAVVAVVALPGRASATSCPDLSDDEAFTRADAVFVATVVDRTDAPDTVDGMVATLHSTICDGSRLAAAAPLPATFGSAHAPAPGTADIAGVEERDWPPRVPRTRVLLGLAGVTAVAFLLAARIRRRPLIP